MQEYIEVLCVIPCEFGSDVNEEFRTEAKWDFYGLISCFNDGKLMEK